MPQYSDHAMIRGRALGHDTDHFAFEARNVFYIRARIDGETVGRHDQGDVNQIGSAQDRVHNRAAGGRHIDIAGNQRLSQTRAAGDVNVLQVDAILAIEPRFRHHPKRQLRPTRLRITDAHGDRRHCGIRVLRESRRKK